jgi:DNA repair protein RecO (recombination protein O)
MAFYKVKGIVIGSKPFGEADKLITLFSKEKGKLKVVARGSRRAKSKFGGRLELFSYNEFFIAETRGLHILSQMESVENFHELRNDFSILQTAAYIVKMVSEVSSFENPDFPLFRLLLWSLHLLKEGGDPLFVSRVFEIKLSVLEGVFPVLDKCLRCGKKVPENVTRVGFSLSEGGVVCCQCAGHLALAKIPAKMIRTSLRLAGQKFSALAAQKTDADDIRDSGQFWGNYIRDKLEIDWWDNFAACKT